MRHPLHLVIPEQLQNNDVGKDQLGMNFLIFSRQLFVPVIVF